MQRFFERLARFLMGRNGLDSLYTALMFTALALVMINTFVGSFWLYLLILAILGWAMFRTFSKNLSARRRENAFWLKIWKKITFGKGPVRNYNTYGGYNSYNGYGQSYYEPPRAPKKKKVKLKTDRDHCFRICPECRANIRLPKQRGKHTVVCPRCKCRFEVRI